METYLQIKIKINLIRVQLKLPSFIIFSPYKFIVYNLLFNYGEIKRRTLLTGPWVEKGLPGPLRHTGNIHYKVRDCPQVLLALSPTNSCVEHEFVGLRAALDGNF